MMSSSAQRLLMPVLVISDHTGVCVGAHSDLVARLRPEFKNSHDLSLSIYSPITSTFLDGLQATPSGYLDLARAMKASRLTTLMQVRVPVALPSLALGIRVVAVYAPIGAVIGEWIGFAQGLGYLMLLSNGHRLRSIPHFQPIGALPEFRS